MKIYPAITTTDKKHFKKLEEANRLGLTEVCFFPTCLKIGEREAFYKELKKSSIKKIPFVHLRDDMEVWELEFLVNEYKTEVFNCHPLKKFPLKNDLSSFFKKIYIENAGGPLIEEEVKEFAGICLDFCHLEGEFYLKKDRFENDQKLINKYPIGCGHISAFRKYTLNFPKVFKDLLTSHLLWFLSDVNYLKKYKKYFPEILAIELENSLKRQIEVIDYISSNICTSKV